MVSPSNEQVVHFLSPLLGEITVAQVSHKVSHL